MASGNFTIPWWKRKGALAALIVVLGLAVFIWLLWLVGNAGHNQTICVNLLEPKTKELLPKATSQVPSTKY